MPARPVTSGVWRLVDAVRVELDEDGLHATPAGPFAELGEDLPADKDTMHLSIGELREEIEASESGGRAATAYRVALHVKAATPLACILLPALALVFAVTGPPFPSAALTLMLSVVVAVLYTLLTGVGTSLGVGGALPPALAGWSTTGICGAALVALGLRMRAFGQSL